MSDGNEFQKSDAATGNVRRPTVVSRNGGMSSWCDDAFGGQYFNINISHSRIGFYDNFIFKFNLFNLTCNS